MADDSSDNMFQNLFDAIPSVALVVDEDARIQAFNRAAAAILPESGADAMNVRAGEALGCIHSTDSHEGCGHGPLCKQCVVRNSINEAFGGLRTARRRTKLEFSTRGEHLELYALVTASSFEYQKQRLVLVIIEDISIIAELTRIIPICASCGKVRDGGDAWVRVESYFSDEWGVDFTHGLCPDCLDKQMKRLDGM